LLTRKVQAPPVEVAVVGLEAKRRGDRVRPAMATLDDPAQDPHVLAEAGPGETAPLVGAEPVDGEDPGRPCYGPAHVEPVPEVIGYVIAAERQHRERVA